MIRSYRELLHQNQISSAFCGARGVDYIIIDKEHAESIKEMNIDEEREITPYSQGEI